MTEAESVVLEHLNHIRRALDYTREDVREINCRLGFLETDMAQVRVTIVWQSDQIGRLGGRIDRIAGRLERIDQRLVQAQV